MAEEIVSQTPFEAVVQKLVSLGFYDFFFPFLITSAILFALLRKSKVLGESNVMNGVVAISVGMLIFGFPVLTGVTYGTELSVFFVQVTIFVLILVGAVIMASVFYPDIMKVAFEQFKSRSFLYYMLAIGIGIFVISGLVGTFINIGNPAITGEEPEVPGPPNDIVIIIAALIIFMILIIIAASVFGMGKS
jgi:hypothetical protein